VFPRAFCGPSAGGVAIEGEARDWAVFAFAFIHDNEGVIDHAIMRLLVFGAAGEVKDGMDGEEALRSVARVVFLALVAPSGEACGVFR